MTLWAILSLHNRIMCIIQIFSESWLQSMLLNFIWLCYCSLGAMWVKLQRIAGNSDPQGSKMGPFASSIRQIPQTYYLKMTRWFPQCDVSSDVTMFMHWFVKTFSEYLSNMQSFHQLTSSLLTDIAMVTLNCGDVRYMFNEVELWLFSGNHIRIKVVSVGWHWTNTHFELGMSK